MTVNPFHRTVCGCRTCRDCCMTQPGFLAPGDFERISAHLGETPEAARAHFVASPGAVVGDSRTGKRWRIGTITPRTVDAAGRCVFLDAEERCRVHAVAPFGCAFYDTHMPHFTARPRTMWALREIQASADYSALRDQLPPATTYNPKAY